MQATLVAIEKCKGANACEISSEPPTLIEEDPNTGVLLAWDERQNVELTEDLRVDRVFDPKAAFVEKVDDGFVIKAGTVVSSHYVQWDPGEGSSRTVRAVIRADSQIFAFITEDEKLFESDALLGLDATKYNNFRFRSLEPLDWTRFKGKGVAIRWYATTPGDWSRLITAYSPSADADAPTASGIVEELEQAGRLDLDIAFRFDSAELTPKGREQLDRFAEAVAALPPERRRFVFIGHTDAKGSAAYNLTLSRERVESVRAYLVEAWNFAPETIEAKGMGESDLKVPDRPNDPANRRVEVRLR